MHIVHFDSLPHFNYILLSIVCKEAFDRTDSLSNFYAPNMVHRRPERSQPRYATCFSLKSTHNKVTLSSLQNTVCRHGAHPPELECPKHFAE